MSIVKPKRFKKREYVHRPKAKFKYAGQYSVENNRWEPEIDGERRSLLEWSELTGVGIELMIDRHNRGWDWEEAIFTPPRKYRDNIERRRVRKIAV